MKSTANTFRLFYRSRYGKPFVFAFFGYCWVAIFLSPELTWEEIGKCRVLWQFIQDFNPLWLNRFEIHHLAWYFPIKLIGYLGFPAIMGANLAAYFGEQSNTSAKPMDLFCWAPLYAHPQSFYPEIMDSNLSHFDSVLAYTIGIFIVVGFSLNKMLYSKRAKIHFYMLVAIVVSWLATMFMPDFGFQYPACRSGAELERAQADYQLVTHDLPLFMTHFNPVVAFLYSYVGVSIMTRVIPALSQPISNLRANYEN